MSSIAQPMPVGDLSATASPAEATLSSLAVGQKATVVAIRCERSTKRRLMELGVLPGTEVEVIRVAPLGDPIELRLRNYSLCVRRAEASCIDVE